MDRLGPIISFTVTKGYILCKIVIADGKIMKNEGKGEKMKAKRKK